MHGSAQSGPGAHNGTNRSASIDIERADKREQMRQLANMELPFN